MAYSPARFYQSNTRFKGADGQVRDAKVYSYESYNKLYDLLIIEGLKLVRVNGSRPSNMICDWTPAHYKIESHFNL